MVDSPRFHAFAVTADSELEQAECLSARSHFWARGSSEQHEEQISGSQGRGAVA